MEHRPFISHQWKDKKFANSVTVALQQRGMKPIIDTWKFVPGESLNKAMAGAIKSCTSFILFWSKHSSESSNVEFERELSLVEARKRGIRIICILLDDTPPPDEHSYRLYIDWRKGKREAKAFQRNLEELCRAISGLPPIEAVSNSNALKAFNKAKDLLEEYKNGLVLYDRVYFTVDDLQSAFPEGFSGLAILQSILGYRFIWSKKPGEDIRLLASADEGRHFAEICRLRVHEAWNGTGVWQLHDPLSNKKEDSEEGRIILLYLSSPGEAEISPAEIIDGISVFVAGFYLSEPNAERFYQLSEERFENIG